MSVIVKTRNNPINFVEDIKSLISDGRIISWSYDKDGDFTLTHEQWRFHAWFRPNIQNDSIIFALIGRNDQNMSVADYAVYHGKFIEMLLRHFDQKCSDVQATPLATKYDYVGPNNKSRE